MLIPSQNILICLVHFKMKNYIPTYGLFILSLSRTRQKEFLYTL